MAITWAQEWRRRSISDIWARSSRVLRSADMVVTGAGHAAKRGRFQAERPHILSPQCCHTFILQTSPTSAPTIRQHSPRTHAQAYRAFTTTLSYQVIRPSTSPSAPQAEGKEYTQGSLEHALFRVSWRNEPAYQPPQTRSSDIGAVRWCWMPSSRSVRVPYPDSA